MAKKTKPDLSAIQSDSDRVNEQDITLSYIATLARCAQDLDWHGSDSRANIKNDSVNLLYIIEKLADDL